MSYEKDGSHVPFEEEPARLDELLQDAAMSEIDGPDWKTREVQLDEYGCDYPRYCKFYGDLAISHFCDRSCTEMPE